VLFAEDVSDHLAYLNKINSKAVENMKKKNLFLLLILIFLSSMVFFKIGYNESEKSMINAFESSKSIFGLQLPTRNNHKFAFLSDSYVENLGGNRYMVDSYVVSQNDNQQDQRIRFIMTLHWNGQAYTMENLTSSRL